MATRFIFTVISFDLIWNWEAIELFELELEQRLPSNLSTKLDEQPGLEW